MRSKADETLVIVETLICPLQISHSFRLVFALCRFSCCAYYIPDHLQVTFTVPFFVFFFVSA